MSLRTSLQTTTALSHYLCSKVFGEQITFQNRANVPVTLWAIPISRNIREEEENGSFTEVRQINFEIALQTGFAASSGDVEPVTIGDTVTYQSRAYLVQDFSDDDLGAIYTLICEERKRLSSGVG